MNLGDVAQFMAALDGVRHSTSSGLSRWSYHGRLVARLLDEGHLVVRAEFAVRDALVRTHPRTFSVPPQFEKHMMVVANLESGSAAAIEDALTAAVGLQRQGR